MKDITVILPVYNGMGYLENSVESVLNQSYSDFEFLILDDCSTDKSFEYLSGIQDARVTVYRNPQNQGLFYNLNFLIRKSQGSLIKLWSQDDIMYSTCLERVLQFHSQHPQIGFSYTGRDYIDEKGKLLPDNKIDNTPDIVSTDLHTRIAFYTGSIAGNIANVTIDKAALEKVGLFNETMKISGDFEMWVRLAKDYPIGFIRERLIQLRNHSGQLSRDEKHYLYHLKEDIIAYNYLFSYVSHIQQKEGRKCMRRKKLLFYYTLMLKAFLKGEFKTGWEFMKILAAFDNFGWLTYYFVFYRVLFRNISLRFEANNDLLFKSGS